MRSTNYVMTNGLKKIYNANIIFSNLAHGANYEVEFSELDKTYSL